VKNYTREQVVEEVVRFYESLLGYSPAPDQDLIESGDIDSLTLLALLASIHETFGVDLIGQGIRASDLTSISKTVNQIVDAREKKL
jgi:acyl carrier protein